ncbi:MAG: DMT family transporter [Candidatus Aenigmatarchaeota archaeon]|nr:MAG: DMT family transporter [Candidatus Aenigmarchaeota archaeon]
MKGIVYLILAGFFIGTTAIWIKMIGSAISPFVLTMFRVFIAAMLSLVLIFFVKNLKILWTERKYAVHLILSGFFGVTIGFGLFIEALQYVPVANVVLLVGVSPVTTAFLAYFFLKENITKWEIIGLVLVILGIGAIYGPEINLQANVFGNILAVLAGAGYSVFVVSMRYLEQKKIPFYAVTFWPMLIGCLFMLLFLPFEPIAISLSGMVMFFVFMLAFSTFLGFTFFAEGLKTIRAHNAPIIILLAEPIVGIGLAWLILGEVPPMYIYLGGFLIILANLLVEKEVRKKKLGKKSTTIYKKPQPLHKK